MTGNDERRAGRRRFLRTAAALGLAGTAGCTDSLSEAAEQLGSDTPTGREPRWRFELSGWAGSPAVESGTLYVGEVFGADEGSLYAVSTADGTREWEHVLGNNVQDPTVRGDTVYAGGAEGVVALSAAGEQRWFAELPEAVAVSGLAVTDDAVYVASVGNRLYALDRADGSRRWTFWQEQTNFYGPAVDGGTVYAGCNQGSYVTDDEEWGAAYAVDAATGDRRWRREFDRPVECAATVADEVVYVGSHALSTADGSVVWTAPTGPVRTRPTVVDGTVYVGSTDDSAYALDRDDGSVTWAFETGFGVRSRPAVADGTVYVGSGDGNLYALDSADGTERWRFELGSDVYADPVVTDETVYVGATDHYVYSIPR
ncbi:outer membrane protein assembly factor BamB family protein [Halosimplex marinum]|uniref:outer membrane protein assembly factor BamB family protein n=1 Tax=Halosimplex marinum TaxID=3396620 RepID=UPI003F578934